MSDLPQSSLTDEKKTTVTFAPINAPSSSKGWDRYKAEAHGAPILHSHTGNPWVSAPHSAYVEPGTVITVTVQTMRRVGKARTARETMSTETYQIVAADGATCIPGSRIAESGINGVMSTYVVGGHVSVRGASL